MFGSLPGVDAGSEFLFPDWSQYTQFDDAAKAYLRDPPLALEALHTALGDRPVKGFVLERMVNDNGLMWQEAVITDGERILLWHGDDHAPDEELDTPEGAMTSSMRVVPLTRVVEVGYRRLLKRTPNGEYVLHGVDSYILLESLDEGRLFERNNDGFAVFTHDAVRLSKSVKASGEGQVTRTLEFAQLIASLAGVRLT